MKLLLAEDTRDLNHAITTMLTMSGFAVDAVYDGEAASLAISENGYDGIILDIMMPGRSGLEVLSIMREEGNLTPVLLLTAKSEVDDRVSGLDAGADDYLTKPFAMKELLARAKALTRRSAMNASMGHAADKEDLMLGDLKILSATQEIAAKSNIRLSVREYALLRLLAGSANRAHSSEAILDEIWQGDETGSLDAVWLYINYLRTKLFSVGSEIQIIGERGGSFQLILPEAQIP